MNANFLQLFPEQASTVAAAVDALYAYITAVSAFFALLIAATIVVFAVRYREGRPRAKQESRDQHELERVYMLVEITWTVIPLALSMVMFVWGTALFFRLSRPPADAIQMYAIGKQWMWKVQHPGGQREINQLHVPVGRPVRLTMASEDVIHSFFIPAFRVKQDVLPGRFTTLWFEATKAGTYHLFCAEYCGTQHSGMIGQVVVMEPEAYENWLSGGRAGMSLAAAGELLFRERGCPTCHLPEGSGRGPSLLGLFGKPVRLKSGGTAFADEGYVRESIMNPESKLVDGFEPVMPTFQGLVTEEQLVQLVAYVKSLAPQPASKDRPSTAKEQTP